CKQLREATVMAEGIRTVACGRTASELLHVVALAKQRLPDEAFTRRKIAVGLSPPATDNLPAPFRNAFPDGSEQFRLHLFDPLIMCRRATGERKARSLLHPIERGAAGGDKGF